MKKKILLMGKSGAGKTSMRSIIFANFIARDTRRLGPTIDVEHAHIRLLGNLVLNLWDCGGQEAFMENYFNAQKDQIFRDVEVLLYVFDVHRFEADSDLNYFQMCINRLMENSPGAKIFCLVHKMDLVKEDARSREFFDKESQIRMAAQPAQIECFQTSIWDETLYRAWSSIVNKLIPNVSALESNLRQFAEKIGAQEALLFEKNTFLVISHVAFEKEELQDAHRCEKVSNIIKQFKLSSSKWAAQFQRIEVKQPRHSFSIFIDMFTGSTYIMIVMPDPEVSSVIMEHNIKHAKKHFEKYESRTA